MVKERNLNGFKIYSHVRKQKLHICMKLSLGMVQLGFLVEEHILKIGRILESKWTRPC